jgi:hypothetical protein
MTNIYTLHPKKNDVLVLGFKSYARHAYRMEGTYIHLLHLLLIYLKNLKNHSL